MSDTRYFWQGGRKIAITQDESAVTIHASGEHAARAAAEDARVEVASVERAAPGLMRVALSGDRDTAMERLRESNVVHHVYREASHPDTEYLITESFFLKFKPETTAERVASYLAEEGLIVEQDLGNKTFLVRVTEQTARNPIRAANAAATRDDVEYAEPNLVRSVQRFFVPADSLFGSQWHLHAPAGAADLAVGAGIFATEAWDLTQGKRDIVVCVADDGFDLTHPDFQGNGKMVAQLNATIGSTGSSASIAWDPNVQPRGDDYHGTPCAGVAIAEANGSGVVGVAPGCAFAAVRFPLSMSDAHFIAMFNKISTIADVVSCSWGVGPANDPMSTALRDRITALSQTGGRRGRGLVFCIAAGNNNCPVQDLSNTRTYRFRDQFGIIRNYSGVIDRWIAAHPNVITVSASTSLKTRSAYSSWGRQICVCAPSNNFDDLDLIPTHGRGITTTDNESFGQGFTANSRFTSRFGGTSSATPTVAGVCGLILSRNAALTASEVKTILQQTADKDMVIQSETAVNEPGTFDPNGFSLWFGHGKVNAFKAVTAALPAAPEPLIDVALNPELDIPDAGAPVSSSIVIDQVGTIRDLRIGLNITHTYIGDLRIDLMAPDGTAVTLHNQTGGSSNNIVKVYGVQDVPALGSLVGKNVQGTWKLRIVDVWRVDIGRLNSWRLIAKLQAPVPAAPAPGNGRHRRARGRRDAVSA